MSYILEKEFDNLQTRTEQNAKAHIFAISPEGLRKNFPNIENLEKFTKEYVGILEKSIDKRSNIALKKHPNNEAVAILISDGTKDNYSAIQIAKIKYAMK